jgi:hypothetical protein
VKRKLLKRPAYSCHVERSETSQVYRLVLSEETIQRFFAPHLRDPNDEALFIGNDSTRQGLHDVAQPLGRFLGFRFRFVFQRALSLVDN